MILAHVTLEKPISFDENKAHCLVIENAPLFCQWTQELTAQCNGESGDFVLSDDGKTLDLEKNARIVRDPLADLFSERKLTQAVTAQLERIAMEDYYMETQQLSHEMWMFAEKLLFESDITLCCPDTVPLKSIIKCLNFQFEQSDSLLERMSNYFHALVAYLPVKLLIFVGIKSYFSKDDLQLLILEACKLNLHLLFLDSNMHEPLTHESITLIDQDLCELRFDSSSDLPV